MLIGQYSSSRSPCEKRFDVVDLQVRTSTVDRTSLYSNGRVHQSVAVKY